MYKRKQIPKCSDCSKPFVLGEKEYFCCKEDKPVCAKCKIKPCLWCHGAASIISNSKKKCLRCKLEEDSIKTKILKDGQKICCSACVATLFRWHYRVCMKAEGVKAPLRLFSAREFSYGQIELFFREICIHCGDVTQQRGYRLRDNALLCQRCFEVDIYQNYIVTCAVCSKHLRMEEKGQLCGMCTRSNQFPPLSWSQDPFIDNPSRIDNLVPERRSSNVRVSLAQEASIFRNSLTSSNAQDIIRGVQLHYDKAPNPVKKCDQCEAYISKVYEADINTQTFVSLTTLQKFKERELCLLCYVNVFENEVREFTRELVLSPFETPGDYGKYSRLSRIMSSNQVTKIKLTADLYSTQHFEKHQME